MSATRSDADAADASCLANCTRATATRHQTHAQKACGLWRCCDTQLRCAVKQGQREGADC